MTGLIKEQGVVIAADDAWVTIRVQRQSTCGSCSARSGCGNGVLSEVLGRRGMELRLANTHGLCHGDRVTLGISDRALVSGALAMYLLPLLGLVLVPVLMTLVLPGIGEGWLVLAGLGGFALGLMGVRGWLRRQQPRLAPVVLAHESVSRQGLREARILGSD